MGTVHAVGPNQLVVKSGGFFDKKTKHYMRGGWLWECWCVTDIQYLPLGVMTLSANCENVETSLGVRLTASGTAIVKVMNSEAYLPIAAEHFLGKTEEMIKYELTQTVDGHLRAILATLTVEEALRDRQQFARLVKEVAAQDLLKMGIEILSFTIKDLRDDENYLNSLGKKATANVKRNAAIGVAQYHRDASKVESECDRATNDVVCDTETKIENYSRMYKLAKSEFDKEVFTARAEAELAYELQAARNVQAIRNEELQIEIIERKKHIEVEEQEIQRKTKELMATVQLPADAESFKVQTIAEALKTDKTEAAKADAMRIRMVGGAVAGIKEMGGKAEAIRMKMKAEVYKKFGQAAITSLVLDALPKIAREVCKPLAKTEEIVLLGSSDQVTGVVNRLAGQIPPAVQALTGLDLAGAWKKGKTSDI